MRKLELIGVLVVIAVLATACLNQAAPTSTPAPPAPQAVPTATPAPTQPPVVEQPSALVPGEITGVTWQWAELHEPDGQSVVADPENYTLLFQPDGSLNIKADCNRGNGAYTLEENRLTFGPMALTQAMCPPGSLSDQFLRLIGSVDTIAVKDGRLVFTLRDAAGEMIFDRAGTAAPEPPARPSSQLVGIVWMWERFADQASAEGDIYVDDPSKYTIEFKPDGTFSYKADCNVGSGTYSDDNGSLSLELGATTLAECGPTSLYNQYLRNLGAVAAYVFNDEGKLVLNLFADAGNMIFNRDGRPAAAAPPGAGAGRIDVNSVTLDTMGLPYSYQPNLIAATPYDASQPPGPKGLPEHVQINFGVVNPQDKQPGDPVIYIIPVQAYRQLWDQAGNPSVSHNLDAMRQILANPPDQIPGGGLPVLPYEEIAGANDLAVQGKLLQVQDGGYRFVGRFEQSPNPVTNEGLRYVFQGFAGPNNAFLVAFFYPVTSSSLPWTAADVPAAEMNRVNTDPNAYLQERTQALNALSESDWDPILSNLDAVIGSLRFNAN